MNMLRKAALATTALAAIAVSTLPALADRYSRDFQLRNFSGYGIVAVYATHVDYPNWGTNILYGTYVGNYQQIWLTPEWNDGYCMFDIRIEYADGYVSELWNVNLCEDHQIVADPESAFVA